MAKISNKFSGKIVCLDKANVDTDQIIPKQFLKSIKKTGLGPFLFDSWRYEDEGYLGKDSSKRTLKNDFVLNNKAFSEANVLVAKENFGCGSSREHAVWALKDFGITTIIASLFIVCSIVLVAINRDEIRKTQSVLELEENDNSDLPQIPESNK